MKKISLVILAIALIYLVEIKGQDTTSGNGEDPNEDTNLTNTSGDENETNKNLTENETKNGTDINKTESNGVMTINENEWKNNVDDYMTPIGTVNDSIYTANGLNPQDPEGTKMHLTVLEGFEPGFRFNLFGKKYYKAVKFVFVMIECSDRLRNRLRMRNLESFQSSCDTNEALLLKSIMGYSRNLSLAQAKQKLEQSRESMLKCGGSSSGSMGIDWNQAPDGAEPEKTLCYNNSISDNRNNLYLEIISKGIAENLSFIHILGVEEPSSSSKSNKFSIISFYSSAIMGGQSVITGRGPLNDVDFGLAKCSFDKIDFGGQMICDESIYSWDIKKYNYAHPAVINNKEIIYLNFVKTDSPSSSSSSPEPSGSSADENFLEKPENGKAGDYSAGGLNTIKDPKETVIHLNVIEGFSSSSEDFSFNIFGKKYKNNITITLIMMIFGSRLRNRLRLRNLDDIEANCYTDESALLTEIGGNNAKQLLDESRNTMLKCRGQSSNTDNLGINWNKSPSEAVPDEALKNEKNIEKKTDNNYLDFLSNAIANNDLTFVHIVDLEVPSSFESPLEFKIKSYYANQIKDGSSIIDKDNGLSDVQLGSRKTLTCEFDGFNSGDIMTCSGDSISSLDELGDYSTINVPNPNDPNSKEQIYLNFIDDSENGSPLKSSSSSGLSGGAIAGIVIGAVAVVVIIGVIIYVVMKKPAAKPQENEHSRSESQGKIEAKI